MGAAAFTQAMSPLVQHLMAYWDRLLVEYDERTVPISLRVRLRDTGWLRTKVQHAMLADCATQSDREQKTRCATPVE